MATLEQIAGAVFVALVLLDVFLTVLYARIGTGIVSARLARVVWAVFRRLGQNMERRQGKLLSFCGPIILVSLVLVWGLGLTLGTALVIHPHLGSSIRASSGETDKDFITALFAGGSSIAIVGSSSYEPRSPGFKLFYLFNSLVGMSVLSLTLTYLMQIYTALQRRNSLALSVDLQAGRKGDAAEMLAGLGPHGHFDTGYTTLANLSEDLSKLKEAHHFYPVLFYFRFDEPYYSVSRLTNTALDAVSIVRTALDPAKYGWFIESGPIQEIWDASLLVLVTLEEAFVSGGAAGTKAPDPRTREQWRQRFFHAAARLQQANIQVTGNLDAAANSYVELRSKWCPHIENLAPAMLYSMEEVDPAGTVRLGRYQQERLAA